MARKWILIDCPYLFNRNFHALKSVSDRQIEEAVLFSFFRDVHLLREHLQTPHLAFCFDRGDSLRTEIHPTYKSTRKGKYKSSPKNERRRRVRLHRLIKAVRSQYLRKIGFRNVFSQNGYEADDIIASICLKSLKKQEAVIVTADHDFYQLLRPNISIWHPSKQQLLTFKRFRKEWQVEPEQWASVKAIAGCETDDVHGIRGIGEILAARFVNGRLNHDSKHYKLIVDNLSIFERNLPLVKLPFPDVNRFRLKEDEIDRKNWKEFARRVGIKKLLSLDFT